MNTEKGISLLEVLVALIVLSVGLLGVASLQGLSKRANHEALQRTIATYLADEIIERMRANSSVFKNTQGEYKISKTNNPYDRDPNDGDNFGALGRITPSDPASLTMAGVTDPECDIDSDCTPSQLVIHDLKNWELELDGVAMLDATNNKTGGLVNSKACIITSDDSGKVKIIIAWQSLTETTDADSAGLGCSTVSDDTRRQLVVDTFI